MQQKCLLLQQKCELKWQTGVYHDHKDCVHGWR